MAMNAPIAAASSLAPHHGPVLLQPTHHLHSHQHQSQHSHEQSRVGHDVLVPDASAEEAGAAGEEAAWRRVEALLKSTPRVDVARLQGVAVVEGIPEQVRLDVWKVVLGVLPRFREAWEVVLREDEAVFEDVVSARAVLDADGEGGEEEEADVAVATTDKRVPARVRLRKRVALLVDLYRLYTQLRRSGQVSAEILEAQLESHNTSAVAKLLVRTCPEDDNVTPFWCLVRYMDQLQQQFPSESDRLAHLTAVTRKEVRVHDPELAAHVFDELRINLGDLTRRWFSTYFMCFRWRNLTQLWDRVILVSQDMLAYTAAGIFMGFRGALLKMKSGSRAARFLENALTDRRVDSTLDQCFAIGNGLYIDDYMVT